MHAIFISAVIGYLLGSIPFGYLLVQAFRGSDVRTTGSGNIGATNVARTSPVLGFATLALDAAKGFTAVLIAAAVFPHFRSAAFVAALAAVCGHVFPLWLNFRGGKGVATGLGSFILLTPKAILIAIGLFLAVAAAFRYVSLASIVAAAWLPLIALLLHETHRPVETILLAAASLLIIAKHHANIRRLLSWSEPRFQLKSK
jgi:acyl phosphate:glycerol-3-phosphate acyltransferase